MFTSRRPLRFALNCFFALITTVTVSILILWVSGVNAPHFAFIDSVKEISGLQRIPSSLSGNLETNTFVHESAASSTMTRADSVEPYYATSFTYPNTNWSGSRSGYTLADYNISGSHSSDTMINVQNSTLTAAIVGNELVVQDTDSIGRNNKYIVNRIGNFLNVSDANEQFTSDIQGGKLTNGGKTISIDLTVSTINTLTINGGGGDDTLIVDLGRDNPIPAGGLFYNGGDEATKIGDAIQIVGGDSYDSSYTPTAGNDGIITLTATGASTSKPTTIYFTSLEPIQDSVPVASLIVNGTPTANTFSYTNGPDGGIFVGDTGIIAIDAFETIEFNNKTNLTLNSLAGDDVLTLNTPLTPAGLSSVTVNGGDDNDIVNLLAANVASLTIDGNAGNNSSRIAGTNPGIFDAGNIMLLNSALEHEIGGTTPGAGAGFHDQINATGSVNIGSNVALVTSSFGGFVPTAGQTFEIINRTGGTGTFNGLVEGGVVSTNFLGSGFIATISYIGGDGDDVVIRVSTVTAANVSISGRVLTPSGRGVPRAIVHITDQNGNIKTARTNPFGYYRFEDLEVGQTLIFNVYSKQYQFTTQVVNVKDSISGLNFIAQSQDDFKQRE